MTYKERLVAGLKALGWVEDRTDKSKYTAFTHPEKEGKAFVGQYGALRLGECASRSFSIGDPANQTVVYKEILAKGTHEQAS